MPFIYFIVPGILCLVWGIYRGLKEMQGDKNKLN